MRRYLIVTLIALAGSVDSSFAAAIVAMSPAETGRLLVHAPAPEDPINPANFRGTHIGIYLLRVQIGSGVVTQVLIGQSAGDTLLDRTALKALRTWRFRPDAVRYRKITSVPMSPPQTKQETLFKVPVMFKFKD